MRILPAHAGHDHLSRVMHVDHGIDDNFDGGIDEKALRTTHTIELS